MGSWLKELISSAPVKESVIKEEEVALGHDFKSCEVCGSSRRCNSASGRTLCAACWMAGHGQETQVSSAGRPGSGRRASGPSAQNVRPQRHGEHDAESRAAAQTASLLDFGSKPRPSSSTRNLSSALAQRSAKKQSFPEARLGMKPQEDPLADLMFLPPPAAVGGRLPFGKSQSSPSIAQQARSRPESYRDKMQLLALHRTGKASASNQSTTEASHPISEKPVETPSKGSRRERRSSDPEASLRQQRALTDAALACQGEPLPGGYRCGEIVQSLISRERNFMKVLEKGHEGIVIGVATARPSSSRGSKGHRERDESMPRLLVQFKPGFDWLLAPHQICPPSALSSTLAAGLPGGFGWGDRVRSLVECMPAGDAVEGFSIGDAGTIIGPGHTPGKVAVRFDSRGGEFNIWPGTVCRAEAFDAAVEAPLAGGFRRGDRVHTRAARSASTGDTPTASRALELEEGEEGVVLGPGHADGRILVRFYKHGRAWSMMPAQITLAGAMPVSKEPQETIVEMAVPHVRREPAVRSTRNSMSGGHTLPAIGTC